MAAPGSTVVRRQLGRRLRGLRDRAGKTERDVEEANLASRAKLWRIESGKTPVKVADVRALCWLYGADVPTTEALAALAVGTSSQGWWEEYGDVLPDWFGLYVGLEATATEIRVYDPELIHGLLQTPSYTRAVFLAVRSSDGEERLARRIELRRERQRTLARRDPPFRLTAVFGAVALARPVGGEAVMAEQRKHLRALADLDFVELRVLPWDIGAHPAMHMGAFTVFDFANPDDPAVVYLETHAGARYLEKPHELAEYNEIFDQVQQRAIPLKEYLP